MSEEKFYQPGSGMPPHTGLFHRLRLSLLFRRLRLSLLFTLLVFVIMLFSILLVFGSFLLLMHLGLADERCLQELPLAHFAFSCLITGTLLSLIFSHRPLKPLYALMKATDQVAGGDYSVRVTIDKPEEFRQLSESFNHMVEEINSVELLRTDFVNNFSHEFKTPIVSIRGFARLLKQKDLTREEQEEYLSIIISESERLADLSSHVLTLSRLEKQTILTDRKTVNIAEQIRLAIVLLDPRWTDRQATIDFESPELYVNGSAELLEQVWINLLDNAYKFSPVRGKITIRSARDTGSIHITFLNQTTEPLSEEACRHIFDKFYQADPSHSRAGNGLGLAIVRRVLALHDGSITVSCPSPCAVCFTVQLPAHAPQTAGGQTADLIQ